jgi:hypothetical protein
MTNSEKTYVDGIECNPTRIVIGGKIYQNCDATSYHFGKLKVV